MKFIIQYVSRRRWCHGVDPEDQSWRTAESESFEGTELDAIVRVLELDQETDLEFIHRAVPALERAS